MSNAGGAGRRLGGALEGLAGYEDPQVAKAKLLDEAKNEVDQSGADLMQDPSAYYSAAYQALSSRGLQDEAAGVRNIMLSEQAQAAKTAKDLRGTDKGFSPVDDKGYVTNKTDGTTRQVPGYPVDSPTEDKTKNVETYQLPDGILIQAQDGSEEAAKILAGGGVPYRAPTKPDPAAAAIAAGVSGVLQLEALRQQARTGGGLDAEAMDGHIKQATAAQAMNQSLDNVQAALASGDTQFGSLADLRRNTLSFMTTFAPSLAESTGRFLKLDINSYDALERESTKMLAELAKDFGGNRASAYALQVLAKAGPSAFQTNEGIAIVSTAMRKRNQYAIDKARFILEWQEANNGAPMPAYLVGNWQLDNSNNSKYTLSQDDIKDSDILVQKAERYKRLAKQAITVPSNRDNFIDGKLYIMPEKGTEEPSFYRYDAKSDRLTEAK